MTLLGPPRVVEEGLFGPFGKAVDGLQKFQAGHAVRSRIKGDKEGGQPPARQAAAEISRKRKGKSEGEA